MKKLVHSKWSKRFLLLCILLQFCVCGYIVLFVGEANTYIDNVSFVVLIFSVIIYFVRCFVIEYWETDEYC